MESNSFEISTEIRELIRGKTLLFDSCVFINIQKLGVENVLDEFKKIDCTLSYIHPVYLELMRTDNIKDRVSRAALLDKHEFILLPLNKKGFPEVAQTIQEELHSVKCHPDPEDIYLGAVLATTGLSDLFLLTTNQRDFPLPVYERKGNIIIQNNKFVRPITILKYSGLKV